MDLTRRESPARSPLHHLRRKYINNTKDNKSNFLKWQNLTPKSLILGPLPATVHIRLNQRVYLSDMGSGLPNYSRSAIENRYIVFCRYVSPARSSVVGN